MLVCPLTGQTQDAPPPQSGFHPNIIRVSTNLVTLPVSVMDSEGRAVHNLESRDFVIEEDDRPETISKMAEAGQSPLRLALLFDLSGSVNPRFHFEQAAAIGFLQKVWKPGDTISSSPFPSNLAYASRHHPLSRMHSGFYGISSRRRVRPPFLTPWPCPQVSCASLLNRRQDNR